jgi:hypothetical protein
MTMIVGVIAKTGIILASETRCMIGNPEQYLAYHERARKIAVSIQPRITCAIACSIKSSYGRSIIDIAKSSLLKIDYQKNISLEHIHSIFQENICKELPPGPEVISILAKYVNGTPTLSFGNLSKTIKVKNNGVFSYPPIEDGPYEAEQPTEELAIQFVKKTITERSQSQANVKIGGDIEIIRLTTAEINWIHKFSWTPLPSKLDKLYFEWKQDRSILEQTDKKEHLEEWQQKLEEWFNDKLQS